MATINFLCVSEFIKNMLNLWFGYLEHKYATSDAGEFFLKLGYGLNLIFTVQLVFSKVSEHHCYHLKCHRGHCAVAVSHCHGELLQGSGVVGQGKRCSLRRS